MTPSPLPIYQNILNQANSFEHMLAHQFGPGRQVLNQAAELIRQADRVVVSSIGASYAASIPFSYGLADLGQRVFLEDASELLHYLSPAFNDKTLFILISRSGDTIEIVKFLKALKGRGSKIIGLTNVPGSQLATESDIFIDMASYPDELVAIQTYSVTVLLLYLLTRQMAGKLDTKECLDEINALPQKVDETIRFFQQISPTWKDTFKKYKSVYLLARGTSLASSCEGGLLFHEVAWYPANGLYSAGHFRHGPWEVVDKDFLGFVFAQNNPTYELDLRLAYDLARMGGEIKLITSQTPANIPAGVSLWKAGLPNQFLSPLLEVIPLQFFVYEFAQWQGHVPGDFRVSTPITLSELGSLVSPAS